MPVIAIVNLSALEKMQYLTAPSNDKKNPSH